MSSAFWTDFDAGVARAAGELEKLADDPLLLSRIVANPDAYGLDRPGRLAGYVARVAEGLRRDDEPAAAPAKVDAPTVTVDAWFVGRAQAVAKISDCCPGTDGLLPTVVIRFPDDASGRKAAARVFELLAGAEGEKRDDES